MKITVFGSSGGIGRFVVSHALAEGYEVKAYVRSPEKITVSHQNLELIKGELNDYQKITEAISGAAAVISALGPSMDPNYTGFPVLEGHQNIVKAMKAENVSRFITLATPSVPFEKDVSSDITDRPPILAKQYLPVAYKEIVQVGDLVRDSGLDWTIVRILHPTDDPATGIVRVSFGDREIKPDLSREDIAAFILGQVKDTTYIHSMPIIGG